MGQGVNNWRLVVTRNNSACTPVRSEICYEPSRIGTVRRQVKSQCTRKGLNLRCWPRLSMICLSSRRTRRALDHIQPTHLAGIGITPLGEIARIARLAREYGGEKVGDQRADQIGRDELINRPGRLAEGHIVARGTLFSIYGFKYIHHC